MKWVGQRAMDIRLPLFIDPDLSITITTFLGPLAAEEYLSWHMPHGMACQCSATATRCMHRGGAAVTFTKAYGP